MPYVRWVMDGLHRIFVNTVCDDGSDIANLMSCFTKKMLNNPKFLVFSARMRELKEGGLLFMGQEYAFTAYSVRT